MSYLFDASAFLDLIRRKKDWVFGQYILDLTLYEVGNAIWKEAVLFKSIKPEEASEFMRRLSIIVDRMNIIRIREGLEGIISIAIRENLTYYDAAYLYFAMTKNLILVTNDKKLYNASKKLIKVLRSEEIK